MLKGLPAILSGVDVRYVVSIDSDTFAYSTTLSDFSETYDIAGGASVVASDCQHNGTRFVMWAFDSNSPFNAYPTYSDDGVTWTEVAVSGATATVGSSALLKVTWAEGLNKWFGCLHSNGYFDSSDGITWSSIKTVPTILPDKIVYDGSTNLVAAHRGNRTGSGDDNWRYSTDGGSSWNSPGGRAFADIFPASIQVYDFIYVNSKWLFLTAAVSPNTSSNIYTVSDITTNSATLEVNLAITDGASLVTDGTTVVIASASGLYSASVSDLTTWTQRQTGIFVKVNYSPKTGFVSVNGDDVYQSDDGITWNLTTATALGVNVKNAIGLLR